MEWYLKVVRDNYANFEGRARRQEYWMFVLFNIIFLIAIILISVALIAITDVVAFVGLYIIYILGTFILGLAVLVRRLHDTGKSGWHFLVYFIPLVGPIWLLVLMATEGDRGSNEYGPDPKGGNDKEINDIGKPLIES